MGRKALNQRFTFFGASFSSLRSAMVLSVPIVLTSVSDYRLILDEWEFAFGGRPTSCCYEAGRAMAELGDR